MKNITLDIAKNTETPHFILRGTLDELINNKRLVISLKRMGYFVEGGFVCVPFKEETQIKTLQEIQRVLTKLGFSQEITDKTKQDVESFDREEKLFEEFCIKARSIRNNKFEDNQELVADFDEFQRTLNEKLDRTLYDLQLLSAFHMAFAQNSCNFSVPGAGKTSIVYGAYAFLKNLPEENKKHVDHLLVIGPLSSFAPWENEFKDTFGYSTSFQRLSGSGEVTKEQKLEHLYSGSPAEVTLIFHGGVDSFRRDISDFLKRNRTMVVVDEAHRIKNHEGVWGRSITDIAQEAIARVVLTGTPVPNGYEDLFNLFKFIYPFKYNDILQFHYHNLVDMTKNSDLESPRVQKLKDNLAPFFIRIKKEDLKPELPEQEERIIKVDMEPFQREIYDFIESKYIESFKTNSSATVKDVLNKAKLIRLRQASTNPSLLAKPLRGALEVNSLTKENDPNSQFTLDTDANIDDSDFFNKIFNYSKNEVPVKFTKIHEILKEIISQENEKVIIWTIFIQNAKDLQEYLLNKEILSKLLIGEIPQEEREKIISKFNDPKDSEFQVVIANPFSVAESISLHKGCHNAIYMERDYNCSNFLQSKDRIHRYGLSKDQITRYFYVISSDSVDEVINKRLIEKVERMEEIINDEIPLFSRIDDNDETDIIKDLLINYAQRS